VFIDLQVLPRLLDLLADNHEKSIKTGACWTISNITAGNEQHIQHVIDANIISPLVQLLQNPEFDIKKEAAWVISNATYSASVEQLRYLASQECIAPLCDLLTCSDPRTVTVCLEAIENILKLDEPDEDLDMDSYVGKTRFRYQYISKKIYDVRGHIAIRNLKSHANTELLGILLDNNKWGRKLVFQIQSHFPGYSGHVTP
ncbi:importin subunit alpha-1-like, partial [Trifolium medium]|nr:importin subunit alpha-1-like [Trifolium medium]